MRTTDSSGDNNNDNSSNSDFYRALRERLTLLDFGSFQRLVVLWLAAKGYRHIRSLGRRYARGRRRIGGADYLAEWPGSRHIRIAIQIRHWRTPIQRRAVDELRGFMLRHRIPSGLIIASNRISERARLIATDYPGQPIRLVSVTQLTGSLAGLGLGVRTVNGRYVPDEAFFRTLTQLHFGSSNATGGIDNVRRRAEARGSSRLWSRQHWFWLIALVAATLAIIFGLLRGGGR